MNNEIASYNYFPKNLGHLDLRSNQIYASGCYGISELLLMEGSSLSTLQLSNNKIKAR